MDQGRELPREQHLHPVVEFEECFGVDAGEERTCRLGQVLATVREDLHVRGGRPDGRRRFFLLQKALQLGEPEPARVDLAQLVRQEATQPD